jgi:hypothetical protein
MRLSFQGVAMPKASKDLPLVRAAVNALVPGGILGVVPGIAPAGQPENHCHFLARQYAQKHEGAAVVAGWTLEGVRHRKATELRCVFDFHSVVRLPDGRYACPSTKQGETILFVPDSARAYDFDNHIGYNLAVFANYKLESAYGPAVPPFTLAWSAPCLGQYLYSKNRKHSRWVTFGWSDPFAFAKEQGLDTDSLFDVSFVSDLDSVWGPLGIDASSVVSEKELLAKVWARRGRLSAPVPYAKASSVVL